MLSLTQQALRVILNVLKGQCIEQYTLHFLDVNDFSLGKYVIDDNLVDD